MNGVAYVIYISLSFKIDLCGPLSLHRWTVGYHSLLSRVKTDGFQRLATEHFFCVLVTQTIL